jgi:hypothetical protein
VFRQMIIRNREVDRKRKSRHPSDDDWFSVRFRQPSRTRDTLTPEIGSNMLKAASVDLVSI